MAIKVSDTQKIANATVSTDMIIDLAVTTPKIANNAVTQAKLDRAIWALILAGL